MWLWQNIFVKYLKSGGACDIINQRVNFKTQSVTVCRFRRRVAGAQELKLDFGYVKRNFDELSGEISELSKKYSQNPVQRLEIYGILYYNIKDKKKFL